MIEQYEFEKEAAKLGIDIRDYPKYYAPEHPRYQVDTTEKAWKLWKACSEQKDKIIAQQAAELEDLRLRYKLSKVLKIGDYCHYVSENVFNEFQHQSVELEALRGFAIWLTGCGYDFTKHKYFLDNRHLLISEIAGVDE